MMYFKISQAKFTIHKIIFGITQNAQKESNRLEIRTEGIQIVPWKTVNQQNRNELTADIKIKKMSKKNSVFTFLPYLLSQHEHIYL